MVHLLFNPQGRITAGPFWRGIIILLVVSTALGVISAYGPQSLGILITLLSLAMIYPSVCVYVKRFHDAGKSGVWYLAVLGVNFLVGMVVSMVLVFPRMQDLAEVGVGTPEYQEAARAMTQSVFLPSMLVSTVVALAVAYFVAQLKSDPEENVYGPPTGPDGMSKPVAT